jgi:ABC-type lipoprotein release transport system permease subunit
MAKRHWGSPEAALGKRVAFGGAGSQPRWLTIVGVSGDTKPADITLATSPQIYVPIAQQPTRITAFLIRSAKPGQLAAQVRAAVRRVDPSIAVYDARTMDESLAIDMSSNYVLTGMYTAFAVIALSLAAAGLYGVMSYSVSQRTREMGIRVALGATAFEVQRMVLAQGGRLLLVGTILGTLGGAAIATAIRSLLYGVTPSDPVTYASVIALMVVVMGVATYIPARRAMSVDPVRALRAE